MNEKVLPVENNLRWTAQRDYRHLPAFLRELILQQKEPDDSFKFNVHMIMVAKAAVSLQKQYGSVEALEKYRAEVVNTMPQETAKERQKKNRKSYAVTLALSYQQYLDTKRERGWLGRLWRNRGSKSGR